MKRKRRYKPPIRLDAKPTRPHGGKHGARGYNRRRAKLLLRREAQESNPERSH